MWPVAMVAFESRVTQQIVPFLISKGRTGVMIGIVLLVAAIAIVDARIPDASLGSLYMFPVLLAALFMSARAITVLAFACAVLRCTLDNQHSLIEYAIHFSSTFLACFVPGLFMSAVIRNHETALRHLRQIEHEQALRAEAEQRLRTLVESSPAAIFTLNQSGNVVAANRAADALFGMRPEETLQGQSIACYMPALAEALRLGIAANRFEPRPKRRAGKRMASSFFPTCGFPLIRQLAARNWQPSWLTHPRRCATARNKIFNSFPPAAG